MVLSKGRWRSTGAYPGRNAYPEEFPRKFRTIREAGSNGAVIDERTGGVIEVE